MNRPLLTLLVGALFPWCAAPLPLPTNHLAVGVSEAPQLAVTPAASLLSMARCDAVILAAGPASGTPADQPPGGISAAAWREAGALMKTMGGVGHMQALLAALCGQMIRLMVRTNSMPEDEAASIVDQVLMPGFQARLPELLDKVRAIWANNTTADELSQLRAFYATPLGQKLLQNSPRITSRSMEAGISWAQQVASEIRHEKEEELRKRGLKI